MRLDGRAPDEKRPVSIETDFVRTAYGSCLIATGNTRVICTASVEEAVPPFLKGKGQGWVTAEYAMLPASTTERKKRDGIKKDGRSVEIQRLIGRGLVREKKLPISPVIHQVAAISAGVIDDVPSLDLCYQEDSHAQVDMNFVMNEKGEFIELQGTGEGRAFTGSELDTLMKYASKGINELMAAQREALGDRAAHIAPKPLLLVATGNEHKLRELQEMFKDFYTLAPMTAAGFYGPIEEDASTFAGNAAIKAEAVCAATGYPAIGDDSGLEVDALDGEPGVLSARYAGEHGNDEANNDLLLSRMEGKEDRSASFRCALALKIPGKDTIIAEGSCPGVILTERRGTGGFGYDPLFLYEPMNKTYAEMNAEEKNQISHRSRAAEMMRSIMSQLITKE